MKCALIVDSKQLNRCVMMSILKDEYRFLEASSGREALALVHERADDICVILLSAIMPSLDSLTFMHVFRGLPAYEEIPVVMMTSIGEERCELKGYALGVSDCIRAPFNRDSVRRRVRNIVDLFEKLREIKSQQNVLSDSNERITAIMTSLVEYRDRSTGQHVQRVSTFTRIMMEILREFCPQYDIADDVINEVTLASLLHDIGKIAIPDAILFKRGALTADEYKTMQAHTRIGAQIIDRIQANSGFGGYFAFCRDICLHHHERIDGSGYPDGLAGNENLIYTQIVSLADVYEALTDDRPYRDRFSHNEAVRMICNGECGQFSPTLMACFERAQDMFRALPAKAQNDDFDCGHCSGVAG